MITDPHLSQRTAESIQSESSSGSSDRSPDNFSRSLQRLQEARDAYAPAATQLQQSRDQIRELEANRDKELDSAKSLRAQWSQRMRDSGGKVSESIKETLRDQRYAEELADEFTAIIEEARTRERIEYATAIELGAEVKREFVSAAKAYARNEMLKALSESAALARALRIADRMTIALNQKLDMSHSGPTLREAADGMMYEWLKAIDLDDAQDEIDPSIASGINIDPLTLSEVSSLIEIRRRKVEAASLVRPQEC